MILQRISSFAQAYKYQLLAAAILLIYGFNLFIDVMEIDAAQYALISMEMSVTKSFLQVYQQGMDYLDKPPLLFWLSSLSFLTFGVSNFAYKLPSLLIALLGIYSLYRFTKLRYNKETGRLAAFILASTQALFLITNDIRTDTILLGLVMFSIWQINEYLLQSKFKNLLFASLGFGAAMMAKGPIALIIPIAGFGFEFIVKRQWKLIVKPQWLLVLLIIAITLIPMSYGLYTQFDLHPEKFVYGMQGPSGLRFFYWTQSFGRITGENYWQNDAGYFYFLHTILWDFQPWILLFIPAFLLKCKKLILTKFKAESQEEYISFGAFVFVFMALSLSKYKLPHYIFVLFPFAAIMTADFILHLKGKTIQIFANIQFGILLLFWLLMGVCLFWFLPPNTIILPVVLMLLLVLNIYLFRKLKGTSAGIYLPTLITAIGFNTLMAVHFYPSLLKFQTPSQIGQMVSEKSIPLNHFYNYNRRSFALDFYGKRITPVVDSKSIQQLPENSLVYMDRTGFEELIANKVKFKLIKVYQSCKVTALSIPFLIPSSRNSNVELEYLVVVNAQSTFNLILD